MSLEKIPIAIREQISSEKLPDEQIRDFKFISGGCINNGGQLITSERKLFLKWNDSSKYPGMFELEYQGMQLLKTEKGPFVPEMISHGDSGDESYILMEFVESAGRSASYWEDFALQLSALHDITQKKFGLDHDNYIGSLQQPNDYRENWLDFFIELRLDQQVRLLESNGLYEKEIGRSFEKLYPKLENLLPKLPPSLVHGDLWSGNLITNEKGDPTLIDPAVYYGNREMELAYTSLFGGFDQSFYQNYMAVADIGKDFFERKDIYNLYHLLNHANLFGASYIGQINSILKRFI